MERTDAAAAPATGQDDARPPLGRAGPPPFSAPEAAHVPDDVVELQVRHLAIVVAATLLLAAVGLFVLGNTAVGDGLSIAYPIALVGTAGGTANAARRVQLLAGEPLLTRDAVPRSLAVAQTYLSPIIGGTFAVLLYLVFLGGMLQGEFFPAFACGEDGFTSYSSFATCNPSTNGDAALALVWGFVAGFAERYVPNVLDRFVRDDGER